jgi:hypothetical protein
MHHPPAAGILALPTAPERLICVVCAGSDDTDECTPIGGLARLGPPQPGVAVALSDRPVHTIPQGS